MLGLLKDPSERIFSEKEKDKYLPLQTLFKVNYEYEILDDMLYSLSVSNFYEQIWQSLNQVKYRENTKVYFNLAGYKIESKNIISEDDEEEIIKAIS